MTARWLFVVLVNVFIAFGMSALLVMTVARFARRWRSSFWLVLLAIPFARALVEVARGSLYGSYPPPLSPGGSLHLGFGLGWGRVNLFGLLVQQSADGVRPTSMGELLADGALRHGWQSWTAGIAVVIVAISMTLVLRRLGHAWSFEVTRRAERGKGWTHSALELGRRNIDVYVADCPSFSPFAGGVVAPYVCIPSKAFAELSNAELDAVIAHEVAHVRRYDVVWRTLLSLLVDVFWFCPFVRSVERRLALAIEGAADADALRRGADKGALAHAIVSIGALAQPRSRGFVLEAGSSSKERVTRIVGWRRSSATWRTHVRGVLALVAVAFVANTIFFAVFGGFHS